MESVVSRSKEKCLFDVQVGGGNSPVIATYINYITLTIQCSCHVVQYTLSIVDITGPAEPVHYGQVTECSMDSSNLGHSKISIVHLCSFYSTVYD